MQLLINCDTITDEITIYLKLSFKKIPKVEKLHFCEFFVFSLSLPSDFSNSIVINYF